MGTPFCFYCSAKQIVQYIRKKCQLLRLLVLTLEVSTFFSFDLAAIIHFSLRNKKQGPFLFIWEKIRSNHLKDGNGDVSFPVFLTVI